MRVFLAGAIGERILPLLVAAGHEVAGMTRTPEKVLHQLTNMPDVRAEVSRWAAAAGRMYREGTPNLIAAATSARRRTAGRAERRLAASRRKREAVSTTRTWPRSPGHTVETMIGT